MGEKLVLKLISEELSDAGLKENESETLVYPYITGEYYENDFRFEDGASSGEILLEVWSRGSQLELLAVNEAIKALFTNYEKVIDGIGIAISYLGNSPRRTDVEGLKKLEIRLQINYWESGKNGT